MTEDEEARNGVDLSKKVNNWGKNCDAVVEVGRSLQQLAQLTGNWSFGATATYQPLGYIGSALLIHRCQ